MAGGRERARSALQTHWRWVLPAVVAVLLSALWSWVFYPGFMSFDSLHQYRQVIGEAPLTDAHPIILVYVWRALLHLIDGAGGILLFHQALYVSGLVLFAIGVTQRAQARLLFVVVVSLWPPLAIHMVHIWKDAAMLAGFTLAAGCLVMHHRISHTSLLVVAALALFYGIAVRHNALPAALPLWIWWSAEAVRQVGRMRSPETWTLLPVDKRLIAAFVAGVLLTGASYAGVRALSANVQHVSVLSAIQSWDLVAMSVRERRVLSPQYLERYDETRPLIDQLVEKFSTTNALATSNVISFIPPPGMEGQLTRDWIAAIRAYPDAYFGYRWDLYATMLGVSVAHTYYPFTPGIDPNDLGFSFEHINEGQHQQIMRVLSGIADLPIYRGWFYLLCAGLLLGYGIYRLIRGGVQSKPFGALMLATSCFGIFVPLFFLTPAPDFRYLIWTVMACALSVCVFACDDRGDRLR